MKSFTPSQFRADSSKVYNEVMLEGVAEINHRDRPKMVIMTEAHYEEQLEIYFRKKKHHHDLFGEG